MSYQSASIIDVLLAYGSHGGGLYAAYRHPDNPLLLTDVRWQGQSGDAIETHRGPEDLAMVREEREAWAQIALRSTTLRPDSVGPRAPWLQAPIEPREAYELATRAQRAREASAPPQQGYSSSSAGAISNGPLHGMAAGGYGSAPGHAPTYTPGGHGAPSGFSAGQSSEYTGPSVETAPFGQSYESQGGYSGYPGGYSAPAAPEHAQTTGAWPREAFQQRSAPLSNPQHMAVVVCVEIEMPSLMASAPQDFTKDFARDVALNFNLAARSVAQTRETRGWMHGARMTLGALMSLAAASRSATQGEMEHARDALASALARRTLPYVQMRFADMQEWEQGVPLPE